MRAIITRAIGIVAAVLMSPLLMQNSAACAGCGCSAKKTVAKKPAAKKAPAKKPVAKKPAAKKAPAKKPARKKAPARRRSAKK